MAKLRVGVLGIDLESNARAPVMTERDFREGIWLEGEDLRQALGADGAFNFAGNLSASVDAEVVPLFLLYPEAGGPVEHSFFESLLDRVRRELSEAGPFDGVFIFGHGAGTTTQIDDMDGPYFHAVRQVVGAEVPIVGLLDLHANVSLEMVRAVDVLVSYRTNPHVDVPERLVECSRLLADLMRGARPAVAFRRLPMLIPQVMQLTGPDQPYGDIIRFAESFISDDVLNVSVLSGFPLADANCCGLSVIVTTSGDLEMANRIADEISELAWATRSRFLIHPMTSVDEAAKLAVRLTVDPEQEPLLFADIADNPGGGGRSNTTWLLEAFTRVGARDMMFGLVYDPALAEEATELGEGAEFVARFNRDEDSPYSKPFEAPAKVLKSVPDQVSNTIGVGKGKTYPIGKAVLLEVEGNFVAVTSFRQQILSPDFLKHFGLKPEEARGIVVKSRGHFRAGFADLFADSQIIEVEAPGIVTQNLFSHEWQRVPRPTFPLDQDASLLGAVRAEKPARARA